MVDVNAARQMKALGGRLSFNNLTAQGAYEEALAGPFAANVKDVASTSPYANLLLTQTQFDKVMTKITDEFLPMCEEQYKREGEKAPNALSPAQVKQLLNELQSLDGLLNTPFKKPSDKTLELMPDCVASIKLIGSKGKDFTVEAIVKSEDELDPADPDVLQFPVVKPINLTTHSLYNGCWVVAKGMQFYRYFNGGPKKPGFSLGCSQLVFSRDDSPFAGGAVVEDDDVFLEADEL